MSYHYSLPSKCTLLDGVHAYIHVFFSLFAFGLCLTLSCLPLHIHVQDLIMYMYMHLLKKELLGLAIILESFFPLGPRLHPSLLLASFPLLQRSPLISPPSIQPLPPSPSPGDLRCSGILVAGPVYSDDSTETAPSPLEVVSMLREGGQNAPSQPSTPITVPPVDMPVW